MGSRAVVLVCRDQDAARRCFAGPDGTAGVVYTRTGRRFFPADRTDRLLDRVREAVTGAGLWDELGTGWLILDCELMPWSAQAGDLLKHQYAAVYHDRDHGWHLALADRLVEASSALFAPTRRVVVDTTDTASTEAGIAWWEELTAAGGEGMVVKPLANLVRGRRGLVQPGIKVRGREYLRIIYGPDYTEPAHLERLRQRGLGHKRSLALREYALGLESLERLVRGEPLWRVHEAVFAVLALESEPVDPRL